MNSKNTTTSSNPDFYPEELLDDSKGLDLREFINVISRSKKLIISIAILTTILAIVLTLLMKPIYRAYSSIKVERYAANPNVQILNAETSRSDRDFFETQIQLLQTKTLARRVISDLDLEDKEGNTSFIQNVKQLFKSKESNTEVSGASNAEEQFLDNLMVRPVNNSQLLSISYDSTNPQLAADITNAIAKTFVQQNLERRFDTASTYKKYVSENIEVTKKSLNEAEQRLNDYAKSNSIIQDTDGQSASSYTLKKHAEELVSAEKERIEAEAAYVSYVNNPDATPAAINNDPYILSLKKAASRLETKYQSYKNRTTRTPRRLRKQIDEVLIQIETEVENVKSSFQSRLFESRRKEKMLRQQMAKLREGALTSQTKNTTYTRLLREVELNQLAYNQQLEQLMAVNIASNVATNNISIIDAATPPRKKFKPSLRTNLVLGLLLGSLLGLGIAFLREFIDDSVKSIKNLEQSTGLAVLSQLPNTKRLKPNKVALQTALAPHSPLAESIRSLRTNLRFSTESGSPKTTYITSSAPGEGKSTLAINLASSYAQANAKVLLIDADLRSPSVKTLLSIASGNKSGLCEFLSSSDVKTDDVIQSCSIEGLDVITSGSIPSDPVELLSSDRMTSLIKSLSKTYDHIIIDGAPVLGLADSLILANISEATLIAVESGKTKKSTLLASIKRLERAKANIVGTVLTRVKPQNNPDYNLDYYSYSNRKRA